MLKLPHTMRKLPRVAKNINWSKEDTKSKGRASQAKGQNSENEAVQAFALRFTDHSLLKVVYSAHRLVRRSIY